MSNTAYMSAAQCFCNLLKSCEFMAVGLVTASPRHLARTFLYVDIAGAVLGTPNIY